MSRLVVRPELMWLDREHPIYTANKHRWAQNERRLLGGDDVRDELQPFDWEKLRGVGSNYFARQEQAIYPNFADDYMTVITGHLLKFAPKPDAGLDFGTLGEVRRSRGGATPTAAEQIYFSTDSPGLTGTPWDPWWMDVTKRAGATGHRWIYVEGAPEAPLSQADELNGKRPYLCEFSPLDVPMWNFGVDGRLNYAVVRFYNEETQLVRLPNDIRNYNNASSSVDLRHYDYLLMVREGFQGLGPEFEAGGWFKFTPMKEDYDSGNFDDTDGELPFFPHFYQRAKGSRRRPTLSRPGVTELGAAGIAYMNLLSAANFDAWDAAKSIEWLQGVDEEGYELAKAKLDAGSRWIPLQPNQDTDAVPQVNHGEAGAVAHEVFTARLQGIKEAAASLGIAEATTKGGLANTHTGASKNASFGERQVPRIAHVAMNLGASQNTAIYLLERRWGNDSPKGSTNWPDKINLVELVDKLQSFFEVERIAGIRSATLDAKAMTLVAIDKGLITADDEQATIKAEYKASAELRDKLEAQAAIVTDTTVAGGPIPKSKGPGTGSQPQQKPATAQKQADRLARQKAAKGGPKQNPGGVSA